MVHVRDINLKTAQTSAEIPSGRVSPPDPAIEANMEPNFLQKAVGVGAPNRGLPVMHPLMHRTRSVGHAVILSREIDMMLDDSVVRLKPGDVVVQHATNRRDTVGQ